MAKVKGNREGVHFSNKTFKKVEPLISVKQLKERYLYGLEFKDANGVDLPDRVFQNYIDSAVSALEHHLDISMTPVIGEVEYKDYHNNDYSSWAYLQLNNYPVIAIQKIELVYFKNQNLQEENLVEYPQNWYRLDGHSGIVRMVPNGRFPGSLQVGNSGTFFPEALRSQHIPHAWKITYDHGFQDGTIPAIVNHAIGLLAAIQALSVGGNLVLGAGIASESISIDGLSQSIGTTQSAEYSAFSATRKEYLEMLLGRRENDPTAIVYILENYYKGESIAIL